MTDKQKEIEKLLTEREQELEDRNEELEAQHEELTAAIEALVDKNRFLESTLDELNTRNEEVDQIVYRASHDLKSPITTIEGLLYLIEKDREGDISYYLDLAKSSARDMKSLLDMMVRYSNNIVYKDKQDIVNFNELWQRLKTEIKSVAGADTVKIYIKKQIRSEFNGDSFRIESTIYNLLKNSIHFGRSIGGRIELKISTDEQRLRVSVSDNGLGIPKHIQNDVFGMFYRGTNKSKGSGLGLYLCKKNVEAMHGTINLFSSEGMGTAVTFTVPNIKKEKV